MKPRLIYLLLLIVGFFLTGYDCEAVSYREVYEKVYASVVVIGTEQKIVAPERERGWVDSQGLGSGVIVSEDGKIITAAHVVEVADKVKVKFKNGDVYDAKVISAESAADLALIQLETVPDDIVVAKIGDSDELNIPQACGELVQQVANGSPAWKMGVRAGTIKATIDGKELLVGGDIILEVMGIQVEKNSYNKIREKINNLPVGETVEGKVLRDGKVIYISSKLEK